MQRTARMFAARKKVHHLKSIAARALAAKL